MGQKKSFGVPAKKDTVSQVGGSPVLHRDAYGGGTRTMMGRDSRAAPENKRTVWSMRAGVADTVAAVAAREDPTISVRVASAVAFHRRELEATTGYGAIKDETFELLEEIAQNKFVRQESLRCISAELSSRLKVTCPSTIISLINALAPVDEYLQRHCVNVSLLNGLIARWLGMEGLGVDNLILTGLMHDCGKALIPPRVLKAPRRLNLVEFEVVKMHPINSYELLEEFPEGLRYAARYHHEKINGRGYPDSLSYDEIPLEARITSISDVYDAMVSQRAYKHPSSPFRTLATLSDLRDIELDAEIVDVFIRNMPNELVDKPAMMSDGTVGIVRSIDPKDLEYPYVEINGTTIKSCADLYCTSMYHLE